LRAHHRHSLYLLSSSQIFGLTDNETQMVANIARYHRRGTPQKSHLQYVALDQQDQLIVNKLAAILRVANGLDAEHLQKVRDVVLTREDDAWVADSRPAAIRPSSESRPRRAPTCSWRRTAGSSSCASAPHDAPSDPKMFINRELSWLAFNERVVEEAADSSVPLLERAKFAAIAASNLDEFFMVRVASLKTAIEEKDYTPDLSGLTPEQQLPMVRERSRGHVAQLYTLATEILLPALAEKGIRLLNWADVNAADQAACRRSSATRCCRC
jgi:hypothetical protein